jgi:hypothetical protein
MFKQRINRKELFMLFSIFLYLVSNCQNDQFINSLTFKNNFKIKGLSNNPYTLVTECFFTKTLANEVLWGRSKIGSNYYYNSLNVAENKITKTTFNFDDLKDKISPGDYKSLLFYGFSDLVKTKMFTLLNVGNILYVFKEINDTAIFQQTIAINDSIEFNHMFANSDSTLILLDYRANFKGKNRIKTFKLNVHTFSVIPFFAEFMTSNAACYDKANTKYFDVSASHFLITDNLDYKIYLFNNKTNESITYSRPLDISDKSKTVLNPKKLNKGTLDSLVTELDLTPRILNTQFINDSDIIVNYCVKGIVVKDDIKIKNSMIDLLTIRRDSIVYKKTYEDIYAYEKINFVKTGNITQSAFNPYVRSELYHFVLANRLIKVTFKQLIPKSNMSFEKYVRSAKFSILNLKSDLIYSVYEFKY